MRKSLGLFFALVGLPFSVVLGQFGSVDPTFVPVQSNGNYTASALQTDGKVVVGGTFTTLGGVSRPGLARLNANGSLDTGFDPGMGPSSNPTVMAVQADGKILIGGNFGIFNGQTLRRLVRIQPNGSIDTSFHTGSGFSQPSAGVLAILVQPDGKILVAGNFSLYNGYSCGGILRLKSNGNVDSTFSSGTGVVGNFEDLALYPDGRILAVGSFTAYKGVARKNVVRILANGDNDPSFDPGTGPDKYVMCALIQPDGRAVIGGEFGFVNGIASKRVARLNPDGSLDANFNPGTGASNTLIASLLLPDGKILIGGQFLQVNGVSTGTVACLNADGSLNSGFNTGGQGTTGQILSLHRQTDGKLILSGGLTSFNGANRSRIVRLLPETSTFISDQTLESPIRVFPNPAPRQEALFISGIQSEAQVSVYRSNGQKVYESRIHPENASLPSGLLKSGLHQIQVWERGRKSTVMVVVE